jgi:hypothetical protein
MPCAPVIRHGLSAFSRIRRFLRIRRNTLRYCALRLLAAVRYVERNPVAARLCRTPQAWPWSSAAAHLRGQDDGLVEVQPMLTLVDDWEMRKCGNAPNDVAPSHCRSGLGREPSRALTPSTAPGLASACKGASAWVTGNRGGGRVPKLAIYWRWALANAKPSSLPRAEFFLALASITDCPMPWSGPDCTGVVFIKKLCSQNVNVAE